MASTTDKSSAFTALTAVMAVVLIAAAALTEKDKSDIEGFARVKPDFGAVSFVSGAADIFETRDLLKAQGDEVACIIMEPMRTDLPPPGYLEAVRELATRYGVALIFDEVSSGFRIALGGVQEFAGVTPVLLHTDMITNHTNPHCTNKKSC